MQPASRALGAALAKFCRGLNYAAGGPPSSAALLHSANLAVQCNAVQEHWNAKYFAPTRTYARGRALPEVPDWFVQLNNIAENPKGNKNPRRVGRGPGSDRGGSSGRGMKGQKSRSGRKPHLLFEGGQKTFRQFPKVHLRPPSNDFVWDIVSIGDIVDWVRQGRLDASEIITMKDLRDMGCVSKQIRWGVKLLAKDSYKVDQPIHLQVSACSPAARTAVERAGGSVTTVYYNKLGLRALLKPEVFAAKGKDLPGPVRSVAPKLVGLFQCIGQIPPDKSLPPRPLPPALAIIPPKSEDDSEGREGGVDDQPLDEAAYAKA